jgi:hypothetical protein
MDTPEKKPKVLVPRQAQLPLLILGAPLLVYAGLHMAKQMGWIQDVPKAKVVAAKPGGSGATPGGAATAGAGAAQRATPTPMAPGAGPMRGRAAQPSVDSISLPPGKDPLAPLGAAQPTPATPASPPAKPVGPPPRAPGKLPSPPPLPPPIPAPSVKGGFPSPTGSAAAALPPEMAPPKTAPAPRPVPAALAVGYPILRRGSAGVAAAPPPVELVGTISGPAGSLAVVRRTDSAKAQGRYVRPGESLDRAGDQVQDIGQGTVTLGGRGGTRRISLPPPKSGASTTKPSPPPAEEGTGAPPSE